MKLDLLFKSCSVDQYARSALIVMALGLAGSPWVAQRAYGGASEDAVSAVRKMRLYQVYGLPISNNDDTFQIQLEKAAKDHAERGALEPFKGSEAYFNIQRAMLDAAQKNPSGSEWAKKQITEIQKIVQQDEMDMKQQREVAEQSKKSQELRSVSLKTELRALTLKRDQAEVAIENAQTTLKQIGKKTAQNRVFWDVGNNELKVAEVLKKEAESKIVQKSAELKAELRREAAVQAVQKLPLYQVEGVRPSDKGLAFHQAKLEVAAAAHADRGGDPESLRSTEDYKRIRATMMSQAENAARQAQSWDPAPTQKIQNLEKIAQQDQADMDAYENQQRLDRAQRNASVTAPGEQSKKSGTKKVVIEKLYNLADRTRAAAVVPRHATERKQ